MIKSELIDIISKQQLHLPEKDLALSINSLLDQMSQLLGHGDRIEIRGFGSFTLHYRPPRRAHNPKTGDKLVTTAKYAVHFKPGKEMRDRINEARHLPIKQVDVEDEDDDSE